MKKIIAWLVLSSKDPQKVSLMIKGILTGAVTYIIFFAGMFHINLVQTDLNQIIEGLVKIIEVALTLFSAIATLVGAIRKVSRTVTGDNKVLNQMQ